MYKKAAQLPNLIGWDSIPTSSVNSKCGRRANRADVPVCGARTGASQVLTRNRKRKSMRGNAAQSARIERDWQVNRRRAAKHAPGTFASESGTGESSEASKGQRPQVFHATLRGLRLITIGGYGSARKYFGHWRRRKKLGGGSRAASPSSSDQKSSEGLRWPL